MSFSLVMYYANFIFNILSILGSIVVVTIVVKIFQRNRQLIDRVSIRLAVGISVADGLRSFIILFYTKVRKEGILCRMTSFGLMWFTLTYVFLTVAIAINLQLVFIHGKLFHPNWEIFYWVFGIGFSMILSLIPLVFGRLGLDPDTRFCEMILPYSLTTQLYVWFTFLGWLIISCIYCTIVVIITVIYLNRKAAVIDRLISTTNSDEINLTRIRKDISSLVFRVSLYCIIPIITQTGMIVSKIHYANSSKFIPLINFFAIIGTGSAGILNLAAFSIDPALRNAINVLRYKKLESQNEAEIEANHKHHNSQAFLFSQYPIFKKNHQEFKLSTESIELDANSTVSSEIYVIHSSLKERITSFIKSL